jgi:hypothetical protein
MNRRILSPIFGAALLGGVILGCEPGSVTEAREQLGRGQLDTIGWVIPIVDTSFMVAEFLDNGDTVTTPDGLLSVLVQEEDVSFDFTDVLVTEEVTTSIALPAPGMMAPGDPQDSLRFATPAGSDVVSATVSTGWVVRSMANGTICDATVNVSVVDSLGNTVVAMPTNVFVGAGNTVIDSVNANGASYSEFVEVIPSVAFGACVPVLGSSLATDLTFRPMTLASVALDNLSESFLVEEAEELNADDLEFDDFEDVIEQSTLNSATVAMVVSNTADVPVVLNDVTIGAVRVDADTLFRDVGGNLIYETDAGGTPILVRIADAGETTLDVPRNGSTSVSVGAAELVDRVTHILLDDERVAFVASGIADANDGSSGVILLGDIVDIQYSVVVGMDFTIPLAGVEFDVPNEPVEGVDLEGEEIDDIVDRIVDISGVARAENFTSFGVEVATAFAPDSLDESVDIFTQPGGFLLDTIAVSAPPVDAAGLPTAPTVDSVSVSITAEESRVLLGEWFTAGIRIRLLPGSGGGGRGVIRPDDQLAVSASVTIRLERGGQ